MLKLVQGEPNDSSIAPLRVVVDAEPVGCSKKLSEERADLNDHARTGPPWHRVRLDVETPGSDVEHPYLVLGAGWNENGSVGRDRPGAVCCLYPHHAAGSVEQLCAPMGVTRQEEVGWIVGPDRKNVDPPVVVVVYRNVTHVLNSTGENPIEIV